MIEKMKFLSITGPMGDIDRVADVYLSRYEIQLENEKAQALDWNGNPIPGLYVAGEAAGGLHGQERMTACSMPDCSVFGLIAGENAAAEHA